MTKMSLDMGMMSRLVNLSLPFLCLLFAMAGYAFSFYFHFGTVFFFLLSILNLYYRYGQRRHTLLSNFGIIAQLRYFLESLGPEMRQYLFAGDTEERPFNRIEREEVYRMSRALDFSGAFGSEREFYSGDLKLRHSFFPLRREEVEPFSLVFGEERGAENSYRITHPVMVSGMSYGALSARAVETLSRGVREAGIPMSTGEGGYPEHHLKGGGDLIFQMGTAKFGVRREDNTLDEESLRRIASLESVKMIEIKLSQGAKPGKGGLLPAEKVTDEIARLRKVEPGVEILSPPGHPECTDPLSTVEFIGRVQRVSALPVGIKFCLGQTSEFRALVRAMKERSLFPDYIALDGAEGGTGAAPRSFMDDLGLPIFYSLPLVDRILREEGVRDRLKLVAAGRLIIPSRQILAMALGADVIYTARGFMLALGCIQSLQCNRNTCPVGITTHDPRLVRGLDQEYKSRRVRNYVKALEEVHGELLSAMGVRSHRELNADHVYRSRLYRAEGGEE